jgi:hypothetical protein
MTCLQKNPAARRYIVRFVVTMSMYAVTLLFTEWELRRLHPSGLLLYGLAVLPAIPILGMITLIGFYLAEEKDEYQRNMLIQSLLWGLGAILSLTSVWGFLQMYAHVHPFQPFMAFPLFWCFQGIAAAALRWWYR